MKCTIICRKIRRHDYTDATRIARNGSVSVNTTIIDRWTLEQVAQCLLNCANAIIDSTNNERLVGPGRVDIDHGRTLAACDSAIAGRYVWWSTGVRL